MHKRTPEQLEKEVAILKAQLAARDTMIADMRCAMDTLVNRLAQQIQIKHELTAKLQRASQFPFDD